MKKIILLSTLGLLFVSSHGVQAAQVSCLSLAAVNMQYRSTDASSGNQVSLLQNFLFQSGYLNQPATGYFGLLTQAAVKKYQSEHSLPSTGYVGPLTRASIYNLSCSTITSVVGATPYGVSTMRANNFTSLKVTFPAGGEQFTAGQRVPISFTSATAGKYQIDLTKANSAVAGLEEFTLNEATSSVTILRFIGTANAPGNDYRMRVTNMNTGAQASSQAFTIGSSNPNAAAPRIASVLSPQNRNIDIVITGDLDNIEAIYIGKFIFQRNISFTQADRSSLRLSISGINIPAGTYPLYVTTLDYNNKATNSNSVDVIIPAY